MLSVSPLELERPAQGDQQAISVERLFEEVVRTIPGCLNSRLDRSVTRNHHDQRPRTFGAEACQHVQAVHAGHLHVQEDHIRVKGLCSEKGIGPVLGRANVMALVLEDLSERLPDPLLVIDYQQPCHLPRPLTLVIGRRKQVGEHH